MCSRKVWANKVNKYCTKINRRLLPVKAHNVVFLAAIGCSFPFRTVFAKQLGISATAVGIIFCVIPFIKIVTNPLFGFIFDYFKKIRLTLFVIMIFVALSHVAMIFIPPKTAAHKRLINITDDDFFSKVKYSPVGTRSSHDYDPSLLMYSEFRVENKLVKKDRNFTCDVQCSDHVNFVPSQSSDDERHCREKINIEIVVSISVSGCMIYVNLKSGKFFIQRGDSNFSLLKTINETSAVRVQSWVFPEHNCSEDLSVSSLLTNPDKSQKEAREKDELGIGNTTSLANDEGFEFTTIPDSSIYDKNLIYYSTLHKYSFRMHNDSTSLINKDCRLEFTCQTGDCYSDVQNEDSADLGNEFLTVQFWSLLILLVFISVLCSAIFFLMDAVCHELLQEDRYSYGQQRLWGAVGWGIGCLAGGYLNQVLETDSGEVNYAPAFCLLAVMVVIDLIPIYKLELTHLKFSANIWKDVCFILTKVNIAYNVIVVCAVGVLSGFIWNYQFWFMEEIGSSQVLLGLSQTIDCVFEIPCFVLSGYIMKKIGHAHCMNITFLCFGLRYLCFFYMYNPWWTLAVALFHAPTFAIFYPAMTTFAKNESPPGTEATVQSLHHLFFEGIGVAAGSVLGGIGIDKLGSRTSFLWAAVMSFVLLIINLFMRTLLARVERKPPAEKSHPFHGIEMK